MRLLSAIVVKHVVLICLAALLATGIVADCAKAGERERRIIVNCFNSGANNVQSMQQCSGLYVPPDVLYACLRGRYCFGNDISQQASNAAELGQQCARQAGGDVNAFAACAGQRVILPRSQQALLDCAVQSGDARRFGWCAARASGIRLSNEQRQLADCAMSSDGQVSAFGTCMGERFIGDRLTDDQRDVLNCAANANGDAEDFAICAGSSIIGRRMSREQKIAISCAAQSQGDATGFATCAGANYFNLALNPEQQIAIQCVVQTGGQPYAAAGCMATRLTARELQKCFENGIGGSRGCFGDNNDLVGRNGFVGRTMGQIAGGPNSFVRNPGQIWGGDNSFVRNPGQIWGGSNSFVRNPSQFWGGNNSVFNNPGQLIPPPAQIGTVGGKRICLPWC